MGTTPSSIPDPRPIADAADDDDQYITTTPLSLTPTHNRLPSTPCKLPRERFLLCLDVQTTGEDRPDLLSVEAAMYHYDPATNASVKQGEMVAVVRPREGYTGARHLHDMRGHGLTAERLAREGKTAPEVVRELVDLIRKTTGRDEDYDRAVTVVGHGAAAMMNSLMVTLVVNEDLAGFYEEFVGLCRHPECTMDKAVRMHPGLPRYTLDSVLAHLGMPIPPSRGEAVARLYFFLKEEDRDASVVVPAAAAAAARLFH